MNELDVIRNARPDVAPLDDATRRALRDRFVGDKSVRTEVLRSAAPLSEQIDPSPTSTRTRRLVSVAAAAVLVVSVAVLAVVNRDVTRNDPAAVESNDPVTTIGAPGDTVDEQPATTIADVSESLVAPFALLLLSPPPEGFDLAHATYYEPDEIGIAEYRNADHTTQLQVIVGDRSEMEQSLIDLEREMGNVEGRAAYFNGLPVYADGELEQCSSDHCSISFRWDERTFVTLAWTDADAGNLVAGSTRDSLLELIPQLTEDPSSWVAADVAGIDDSASGLDESGSASTADVDIAPRAGDHDDRGPVERFIGVPLDLDERTAWSWTATQQALIECMAAAGIDYIRFGPDDPDPNPERVVAMPPHEQQRYHETFSGDSGCEQAASARTFVANRFPQQWDDLRRELYADPRMVANLAEYEQCLEAAGHPNHLDAPQAVLSGCADEVERPAVLRAVQEDVETGWINTHQDDLNDMTADINALIERAGTAES